MQRIFVTELLKWFKQNMRYFPWRRQGESAYNILIAELLLTRTLSTKVAKVYLPFIERFSCPESLVTTSVEVIEQFLTPLGLQRNRAKGVKKLAEVLVDKYGGKVPNSYGELLDLPYVGKYIAHAVLCFAYGYQVPIVDVNVLRIAKRVFDITLEEEVWDKFAYLIPKGKAREFNYALLDFAALVCRAKKPLCTECPLGKKHVCRSARILTNQF